MEYNKFKEYLKQKSTKGIIAGLALATLATGVYAYGREKGNQDYEETKEPAMSSSSNDTNVIIKKYGTKYEDYIEFAEKASDKECIPAYTVRRLDRASGEFMDEFSIKYVSGYEVEEVSKEEEYDYYSFDKLAGEGIDPWHYYKVHQVYSTMSTNNGVIHVPALEHFYKFSDSPINQKYECFECEKERY